MSGNDAERTGAEHSGTGHTGDGREGTRERLAATIRTLLRHRVDGTICPADAARAVGGNRRRDLMDTARRVAFDLREDGIVDVRRRREVVAGTAVRGPIRITAAEAPEFRPVARSTGPDR